jgi:hypothetical protein
MMPLRKAPTRFRRPSLTNGVTITPIFAVSSQTESEVSGQALGNGDAVLLLMVMLGFTAIAVLRSPRRLHTALYISGMMLARGALGAGVGFLRSPEAAGTLTALCLPLAGIAASIERMRRYRKTEFLKTWK